MNTFRASTIKGEVDTISDQLKKTRQDKNIKLEKAADDLRINRAYLEALESGDFDKIPTGVYGKNFIREYAQYLQLDDKSLLKYFTSQPQPSTDTGTRGIFVKKEARSFSLTIPKLLKNFIIIILLLGSLTYLGFYLKRITAPPSLAIISPQDNMVINDYSLDVKGKTEPEANITINGEPVLSDPSGSFEKEINLKTGINEVTISAQKKYSRTSVITKQILVKNN